MQCFSCKMPCLPEHFTTTNKLTRCLFCFTTAYSYLCPRINIDFPFAMDFKKIISPIVWGNLLGMLLFVILIVVGMWYGAKVYTLHGQVIKVPDVTRIQHTDAGLMLQQYGLTAIVADSGYNRNLAVGSVLVQHPKAGTEVKAGRKIYLTINSASAPSLILPNIADNCDVYEAEVRLRSLGFKLGPKEYAEGDKDWVLGVKCRGREVQAGERIPAEAPIVLVVGNSLSDDEKWMTDSISENEEEYEF